MSEPTEKELRALAAERAAAVEYFNERAKYQHPNPTWAPAQAMMAREDALCAEALTRWADEIAKEEAKKLADLS